MDNHHRHNEQHLFFPKSHFPILHKGNIIPFINSAYKNKSFKDGQLTSKYVVIDITIFLMIIVSSFGQLAIVSDKMWDIGELNSILLNSSQWENASQRTKETEFGIAASIIPQLQKAYASIFRSLLLNKPY